jgi:hypothetical protein
MQNAEALSQNPPLNSRVDCLKAMILFQLVALARSRKVYFINMLLALARIKLTAVFGRAAKSEAKEPQDEHCRAHHSHPSYFGGSA